jgi:hypothetical protein
MPFAEDRRRQMFSHALIKLKRASSFFVALLLLAACQTVPGNVRNKFLDVAQRLRAFPPDRGFFSLGGGQESPLFRGAPGSTLGRPLITPGTTEYEALMQNDHPVPILLSLLRDRDPKIRTLAAAALVAKGDPRLQKHLGQLLEDQSQTFDQISIPPTANYVPPSYTPQTVATAVSRLIEKRDKADFDRYWASHANRDYCGDWFLWQFRHRQFAPLARQHIQGLPSPDRELIALWIGTGRPFQYDGFSEAELVTAAKSLGSERVLAVLRGQPPGTDPDIKPTVNFASVPNQHYYEMVRFLFSHAKQLLSPSDADILLSLETEERRRTNSNEWMYQDLWPIAAAGLRPEASRQILDKAEKRYPKAAGIPLARWAIYGPESLPEILRWFYRSPQAGGQLAVAIYLADPNDQYKSLVAAILTNPDRLKINGDAMFTFAELAENWKANFDQQFVDWIYAQPPDPNPALMTPPRGSVVRTSGVCRKLVSDPRFQKADGQLLYDIEQCLVGGSSKLSRSQADRLNNLITDFDPGHPQSTSESKLQEIRNLLRKDQGK